MLLHLMVRYIFLSTLYRKVRNLPTSSGGTGAYQLSAGGDVNITDSDGDTPLYVVESIETARWLVEHGAVVNRRNDEDLTV